MDITEFLKRASMYLTPRELKITETLGSGQEGYTWEKNNHTAKKVFEREDNFNTELGCYQILQEHIVESIGQFSVPTLIEWADRLLVVEISIVSPPFILDFGKCHFQRPDYSDEVLDDDERRCIEDFGEDWPIVSNALSHFRRFGIFYFDARPGNINTHGLLREDR